MYDYEIKKRILKKLFRLHLWGAKHTSIDNLHKSFPSHLKGFVKKIVKELIKEELILTKPTSYGLEVSLNPQKKNEIYDIVD